MDWRVVVVLVALCPLLGHSCSCFSFPNRFQTLRNGICDSAEVYSAVVLSATCTCTSNSSNECRTYAYSESNQSYSADVRTASNCLYNPGFLKTCMQAEVVLAPGVILQTGSGDFGPDVVINGTLPNGRCRPLICPSNNATSSDDYGYPHVCMYKIRVTEVFKGNYSVGDVITNAGPDTLTSCAGGNYGGILQLRAEYLVGVGGPCSHFQ